MQSINKKIGIDKLIDKYIFNDYIFIDKYILSMYIY